MVDKLSRLVAIHEIRCLKARYCRFADAGDFFNYGKLFASNATIDVRGSTGSQVTEGVSVPSFVDSGIFIGADAFIDYIEKVKIPGTVSAHHCHNDEIDILSADRASGIFAMEDNVWFPATQGVQHMHGFGYYHDTFEKHGDSWLIASLRLQRIHVEVRDR